MTFATTMAELPLCSPEDLFAERGLIVIAPHPDDESLGCGGVLAWAASHNVLVHVVFLTSGEESHPGASCDVGSLRRTEAVHACAALSIAQDNISFLALGDTRLGALSEEERDWTLRWLRQLAAERAPALIAVTAPTDPHGDHRAAYQLVRDATEGLAGVEVMAYPVWSWLLLDAPTAPVQGVRVRIDDHIAAKRRAIACYATQLGSRSLGVHGFVLPKELLDYVDADTEVLLCPAP